MEDLSLSASDLIHQVVKFGLDVYPPIEIPKERTRLNIFYEEARTRYPTVFDQLVASDTEFRISKEFRPQAQMIGAAVRADTFIITNRGPVFSFPLLLPQPVGATGLETQHLELFPLVRSLFFSAIAERKIMRIGLIRELLFDTGQSPCNRVISDHQDFAGAPLVGGNRVIAYRDALCNVRISVEPAEVMKTTRLAVGTEVTERHSYGLHVLLDVNNHQLKPLEDADIQQVLDRATGLWPDELLKYLRERR